MTSKGIYIEGARQGKCTECGDIKSLNGDTDYCFDCTLKHFGGGLYQIC